MQNSYKGSQSLRWYLIWRDAVELWHQSYPVFLLDQDALQSLLVLLNLDELTEVVANICLAGTKCVNRHIIVLGNAHTDVKNHLFGAVDKNAIQYEVGPEQRPLALDVFKQLQFCRLVIQTVWILETRRRKSSIIRTMSAWTTGVLKRYD